MTKSRIEDDVINVNNLSAIADAHGVEQLYWWHSNEDKEFRERRALMHIRASANRQRHALYFEVDNVNNEDRKVLDRLLELDRPQSALLFIKGFAPMCGGVRVTPDHAQSWDLIPNASLDPYWTSDDNYVNNEALKLLENFN